VADDVVWSYSRLLGLNGIEKVETEIDWSTIIYMVAGIEATDDHTVVFHLADGYNTEVAIAALMNAKVNIAGPEWDELTDDQKLDWHYAKGTGPYEITAYEDGNSMVLEKNENYYDYDERYPENKLPYIDKITLVYIQDSSNVLAQAMSGDLDWFGENGKDVLSSAQLEQLSAADTGTLYKYMSSSPANIALKCNQEPFNDIRVRQAMQYAIDIQTIDASYFGNDTFTLCGLWSPTLTTWSKAGTYDDELMQKYTYDPEKAKELLTEAGYPDGFEFTIFLDPLGDADLYAVAADYLSQVGITMNIEVAAEMMESVQASQDGEDTRQSNGYGGGYSSYSLAFNMTGNGAMGNAYFHDDQSWYDKLNELSSAETVDDQVEIANELDTLWLENQWGVVLSGVQPTYDYMSYKIGGYNGEKVYYSDNMRTIFARLWVNQ
jgi:peptide/nickel transport system substrate-binding protein